MLGLKVRIFSLGLETQGLGLGLMPENYASLSDMRFSSTVIYKFCLEDNKSLYNNGSQSSHAQKGNSVTGRRQFDDFSLLITARWPCHLCTLHLCGLVGITGVESCY